MESSFLPKLNKPRFRPDFSWSVDSGNIINCEDNKFSLSARRSLSPSTSPRQETLKITNLQQSVDTRGKKAITPAPSKDDTEVRRELHNVDTTGYFKGKNYEKPLKSYNKELRDNNYSTQLESGQYGRRVDKNWLILQQGRKVVNDEKPQLQGNLDLGFKTKPTFKEERLEDALNRKRKIDEQTRKNGFPCTKGGGNNQRYVEHDPHQQYSEGFVVGSTGFTTKKRNTQQPSERARLMIERPKQISHIHITEEGVLDDDVWLSKEFSQLDGLRDWTKRNTKKAEKKKIVKAESKHSDYSVDKPEEKVDQQKSLKDVKK